MDRHSPYALVADDDTLIRMDACEILKEAGFRCHDAATAEQAIELLGSFGQNIQLLFTDVSMPPGTMTGFDLARHCAQNWPHIGILVASGGAPPGPGDMPDGALFISKPFTPDVVREHLMKILPEGQRPEPLENGQTNPCPLKEPAMRHIDHVVVAVRDLDGAADLYARLGFQVGPRNRHPWGTENRIIQFRQSFIELITAPADADIPPHAPGHFSFGAFVRDYLQRREGMAMLVLSSADAAADAARFAQEAIGDFAPFRFERTGRRPDGSATHVAFSLAFAVDSQAPDLGFFTCQQHFPEAFWNEALQRHPNGATAITGVTIAAPHPQDHAGFLLAFTGSPTTDPMQVSLAGGAITLRPGTAPTFVGFDVQVPDLKAVIRRLRASSIAHGERAAEIAVEADVLHGVRLSFARRPTFANVTTTKDAV